MQSSCNQNKGTEMELFYANGTVALASLIVLHEADLPFTATRIDFSKTEQRSPEYLARNPKGRVPALLTEHGMLTETPAILPYVARLNPSVNLMPDSSYQIAKLDEFNSYIASTAHISHAHRMRGYRWATEQSSFDDMARMVPQNMRDAFEHIQLEYLKGPWVMGDQYTVADAYLFTLADWMSGDGLNIKDFPAIDAHFKEMTNRPAVQKARTY
jgi:glutathione S-transferase